MSDEDDLKGGSRQKGGSVPVYWYLARSQMAEVLLRHEAGDRFNVHSAGTNPTTVRREAVAVMSDLGIDLSHPWSKSVDEFKARKFDYVITVCDAANEVCLVLPGTTQRLHWTLKILRR